MSRTKQYPLDFCGVGRFQFTADRAISFVARPRWWVASDCPMVAVRWLWWVVSFVLVSSERGVIETLMADDIHHVISED